MTTPKHTLCIIIKSIFFILLAAIPAALFIPIGIAVATNPVLPLALRFIICLFVSVAVLLCIAFAWITAHAIDDIADDIEDADE